MSSDDRPYGIGSEIWPGLAKVTEEMGELQQVLGKIMACDGTDAMYWNKVSLIPKLVEELADAEAAMAFFRTTNLNFQQQTEIGVRFRRKLQKFRFWHARHLSLSRGESEEDVDPEVLHDILCLVDSEITRRDRPDVEEIGVWTAGVRREVAAWASAVHLRASDNDDVTVPTMPAVLARDDLCDNCGLEYGLHFRQTHAFISEEQ